MSASEFLIVAIPGLPLAAALLATADRIFGGRLLGGRLLAQVAVWSIGLSAAAAIVAAPLAFGDPGSGVVLGTWLQTASLRVDIGFVLDPLSAVMAIMVAGLSWLVTRFSVNYLHNEVGFGRYFTVLPLFVGAMLFLVLADNYLMLFVAWEVVGACSYLLIAFYRDRQAAAEAGTRAFLLNRLGDAGLLAGLFVLAGAGRGLSYSEVLTSPLPAATATAVGLCFLIGATGKSAQVPLGGWLARAMEGPTPSSALIHGATMVTAGVYLVVRSAPIYEQAPAALVTVGVVGAATVLFGQLAGLTQTDIKGMLAASTNAHLGFMLLLCGLGLYPIAVFHLVAHAFYKTNLFLTAPSVLHHLHGGPDPTEVARPVDTARAASLLVGAAAVLLLAAPFAAEALSLPPEWARPTLALGGLAAVAAFGWWLAARRMVQATFHHAAGTARRTGIAVAVGLVLVAAGFTLGILPGGIRGSWFAELLAPAVTTTNIPLEAPGAATALLIAVLVLLAISGIAAPRFFDRFRAEQPAGAGSAFFRRLYFAASNRMWLDELAERAIALGVRVGAAVDRFDRVVLDPLTGALLPSYGPPPEPAWEARVPAETTESRPADGLAGRDDTARVQAPGGTPVDRLGAATARIERGITSQAGGLYGALIKAFSTVSDKTERIVFQRGVESVVERVTTAFSTVSDKTERIVFQRGVESVVERVTTALAALSEAVERRVFELGPERIGRLGDRVRRLLLRVEVLLGRPVVAALMAFVAIVALWAAR